MNLSFYGLNSARVREELQGVVASDLARIQEACKAAQVDFATLPRVMNLRDFRLLAMDMDSTLINIECIDEIAAAVGKKAEVSAITEAAMRGELKSFSESLNARLALLAGTPESALQGVYESRLKLNPGAEKLVAGAQAAGLKTLLVSGGFTFFTERMKARLGLDAAYSNELEIVDGKLTGRVIGPILDGEAKRAHCLRMLSEIGATPEQLIAVGDGSNDLPMMRIAGLSVAYCAKPAVQAEAMMRINFGGLDTLLQALGESA
jgi:phosphoserine phosphatase